MNDRDTHPKYREAVAMRDARVMNALNLGRDAYYYVIASSRLNLESKQLALGALRFEEPCAFQGIRPYKPFPASIRALEKMLAEKREDLAQALEEYPHEYSPDLLAAFDAARTACLHIVTCEIRRTQTSGRSGRA